MAKAGARVAVPPGVEKLPLLLVTAVGVRMGWERAGDAPAARPSVV
jgi:hypothetical protein